MRQGQQHRRGRGRNGHGNNPNRNKGQNPLSRSYESNGPDVKVRGTAAHVAEKYMALARDAQASGDPVLAENYLQHAEHYNRIITTYREQQMQQAEANGGHRPRQPFGNEFSDGDEDVGEDGDDMGLGEQPSVRMPSEQQPGVYGEGQRRHHDQQPRQEGHRDEGRHFQARGERGEREHGRYRDRQDRSERFERDRPERDRPERDRPERDRPERAERPERDRGERAERHERQADRGDRGHEFAEGRPARERDRERPNEAAAEPAPEGRSEQPRRRERFGPGNEQPEFLRRPVRRPRREEPDDHAQPEAGAASETGTHGKTPV